MDARRFPLIVGFFLAVYVALALGPSAGSTARVAAGNVALLAAAGLAIAAIWRRRSYWAGTQRLFWDILAAGICLWVAGHLGWLLDGWAQREPSWLHWHTLFSLSGTIAPLIALLARPHLGMRRHATAATSVDLAAYGLLAVFIYSYVVLVPGMVLPAGRADAQQRLLALVQINRGLLLTALLATIWFARHTDWRRTYVRLALGVAVGFLLRFGLNLAIERGEYRPGSVHDLAWIVPWLCYAWAAIEAPSSWRDEPAFAARGPSGAVAFSAVPVLLIPTLGYGLLAIDGLAAPGDSFRLLLTSICTVCGLALLTIRLAVQRGELQRSDARMRLLAAATEQTADLILITRADGSYEHANEAFLRATGYTRLEMAGLDWTSLLEGDLDGLRQDIPRGLAAHGIWRGTVRRRRKDGTSFPSACSVSALAQEGGITHYVAVERDVSEELRLRDQLVHSERLSAIGELVAGVAHEINNPLQTIVGCVELMLDPRTGGPTTRDLELVRREAGRAGLIVRNLLSFIRKGAPDRVAADLTQLVRATVELREYHLRQANISVEARYAPQPLPVFANREEIQQVVLNLLLNAEHAITASGRPGRIAVSTGEEGGRQVVEVADSGPGVRSEIRGRIFEPFFTTKEVGDGTGLGLSISHGIALAHGGSLELRASDAGACFAFALPAHIVAPAPPERIAGSDAADRTVLVVDDETPIRRLLSRLLERRGFQVHEAATAEEALDQADGRRFSLILCDVRMPGIGGIELYHRLAATDADIGRRFVFITGDTGGLDTSMMATGASVLAKPFTAADLDAVLGTVLAR